MKSNFKNGSDKSPNKQVLEALRAMYQILTTKLEKDFSQVKFNKLGGDTRPDQNVKKIDTSSDIDKKKATKMLSGYDKETSERIVEELGKDPVNMGVFDPYKSKIAMTDIKARPAAVHHEAHHKNADALVKKYGIDRSVNLYNNILSLVPKDVLGLAHGSLQSANSDPSYKSLFQQSGYNQHAKFSYMQEIVNVIGDLTQKGDRREALQRYAKNKGLHFNELDGKFKKAWRDIVDYANSATEEHMNHKKPKVF